MHTPPYVTVYARLFACARVVGSKTTEACLVSIRALCSEELIEHEMTAEDIRRGISCSKSRNSHAHEGQAYT